MIKPLRNIVLFFSLILFAYAEGQVYEIYKSDTINRVDANNKKQGKWIYFYTKERIKPKTSGLFVNNKRDGLWLAYYENGNRKSEITYQNGKAIGAARFYYENGNIREEGTWNINRWTGPYLFYHENGNLSYEFEFNQNGKRTGKQYYYYDTGELMIEGSWENGKEADKITEYYIDGSVKSEKVFVDGQFQQKESKNFTEGEKQGGETVKRLSKKFNITGDYKKHNKDGVLLQRGYFEHGELMNGEWYLYDVNGKHYETRIVENKKVVKVVEH